METRLNERLDKLETEVGTLKTEVSQNTVNLRALRRVLIPGENSP